MWLSGRLHIEGRLNKGPRLQRKHKDEHEANFSLKTNVTPEKDVMTSANQTPGGHKFAPLVASQQGRANQHEPACFGLPSPWSFPSRSGIRLHAVVQPCFFCNDPFCHEMFRPLFYRSMPFPLVLGCSRPLVGVDTESSEVVQETPHPLFFLAPHTARAPHHFSEHHALRPSRILHARHKSRKQDLPSAQSRPDALTSRLDKRVQIRKRVGGAIVLSPTDLASQEPVVGSTQRVVVARTRAPRDAAGQHCLEYLGS